MENNSGAGGTKPDKFFAGKGFYIVLFLCIAVIAASVWTLVASSATDRETDLLETDINKPVGDFSDGEETIDADTEYESAMWEVPDYAEEVMVEPEAPEIASESAAEPTPQTVYETAKAFVWPVIGQIETPYSVTALVYDTTMSDWRTHDGIDIAAVLGEKVMAAASGTIVKLYSDQLYGTTVIIDHGEGLCSVYSNLAEIPTIKVGDAVLAGETIGSVGTPALCEIGKPTHLHFSMTLDGESVNPNDYLPSL